jgi:hypothetical protein
MADKITEDTIKKLIEQVMKEGQLNEFKVDITGTSSKWKKKIFGKSTGVPTKPDVAAVADFDGDGKNLQIDDFEIGFSSQKGDKMNSKYRTGYANMAKSVAKDLVDPYKKDVKNIKNDIKTARGTKKSSSGGTLVDPANFKVGSTTQADKGLDVYEPDSIAFGQMANIGMQNQDTSDPNNAVGAIQLGIGTAMKEFFKGKTTFKSRIDALNTFTKSIVKNGTLPNLGMKELIQATLISDFLSTIVTEMDSGAGAYNFEMFLAAIAGGSVTGKAEDVPTNEAKGKMGAIDFVTADGSLGSAKYYGKISSLTQAIGGFDNKKGKTTLYVIAIKKDSINANTDGTGTTSDPTKIQALDIYLVSIMPTVDEPKEKAKHFEVKINGEAAGNGHFSSGSLVVSASDANSIAKAKPIRLFITGGPNRTLKKQLSELTKNDSTNIEKAYQRFQALFANLTAANQNAQAYASDGDKAKGEKAMLTLQDSDKQLLDLVDLITGDQSQSLDRATRKITEQKITANFLKKLISESFKR